MDTASRLSFIFQHLSTPASMLAYPYVIASLESGGLNSGSRKSCFGLNSCPRKDGEFKFRLDVWLLGCDFATPIGILLSSSIKVLKNII